MKIVKNHKLDQPDRLYYFRNRQLISLTEGYAFSIEYHSYCKIDENMFAYQVFNNCIYIILM